MDPATIFATTTVTTTTIFATTTVTTTAVPTTTVEDSGEFENREEVVEDLQAGVVEILLGRGMTREEAEIEVKKSFAEGTDPKIVEDLFRIFEDWMRTYASHPVMGSEWTDSDARCVIFAMMTERGIYETERQLRDPRVGMVVHFCTDMAERIPISGENSDYLDRIENKSICPIIYKR